MKFLSSLFLSGVLALFLAACGDNTTDAQHLQQAKSYIDRGDNAEAIIELRNGAKKAPENSEIRYELGKLLLATGDFLSAEKELLRAQSLGVDSASLQPFIVDALFKQGSNEDVVAEAAALANGLSPTQQAYILAVAAKSQVMLDQLDEANVLIEQALALDAEQVDAMVARAMVFVKADERVKGMEWLTKARELDDAAPQVWALIGDIEVLNGAPALAFKSYTKAIDLRPYITLTSAKRLRAALAANMLDEAGTDLQRLDNSGFKNYWYVKHLAALLGFQQGDFQAAANGLDEVLAVAPDFVEALIYGAASHTYLGNYEQAQTLVSRLATKPFLGVQTGRLQGALLFNQGDFKGAEKILADLESKTPGNPTLLQLLAKVNLVSGNAAMAERYANRLLAIDKDSAVAQELLTLAKLMSGQDLQAQFGGLVDMENPYQRQLFLAISEFHQGRAVSARNKAIQLHKDFPDAAEPKRLIAASYLALQQWDGARAALNDVLKTQPGEITTLMNFATMEFVTGNQDAVAGWLEQLSSLHPKNAKAVSFVYDYYLRLGDAETALAMLDAGVGSVNNNGELLNKLIQHYFITENYDQVIEKARGLSDQRLEKTPQLLEMLAISQGRKGQFSQAVLSMRKFMTLVTPTARSYSTYAELLQGAGNSAAAVKSLMSAVTLAPDNIELRTSVVRSLAKSGQYENAKLLLGEGIVKHGRTSELTGLDGWISLLEKDYPAAQSKLAESVDLGASSDTVILLARALAYQGDSTRSLEVLNERLATEPQNLKLLLHKAGLYLAKGEEAAALTVYNEVLIYYPEHLATLNNVAWLSRENNIELALATAKKAYALSPRDPFVLDTYGDITVLAGNYSEGVELIREALQRAPGDNQIKLHLARVLIKGEDNEEARRLLEAIVSSAPESDLGREAAKIIGTL